MGITDYRKKDIFTHELTPFTFLIPIEDLATSSKFISEIAY